MKSTAQLIATAMRICDSAPGDPFGQRICDMATHLTPPGESDDYYSGALFAIREVSNFLDQFRADRDNIYENLRSFCTSTSVAMARQIVNNHIGDKSL